MTELYLDELKSGLKEEHKRQLEENDYNGGKASNNDQLRQDQEEELEGIQKLWNKILHDDLRLEIYSHCCKNSFGFLHPVIGLSDTSLEWYKVIRDIVPQMRQLDEFLKRERTKRNIGIILPRPDTLVWEFTKYFKPADTKVVIVGQDPYPEAKISDGLGFSTQNGLIPPSLKKIFRALELDLEVGFKQPNHGSLIKWAEQGVLMIDAALTVKQNSSGSHLYPTYPGNTSDWKSFKDGTLTQHDAQCFGWEYLIRTLLMRLANNVGNVVFMFWGAFAKNLSYELWGTTDGPNRNLILEADHPMVGVYNNTPEDKDDFLNCHHFSKANKFLREVGREEIDWTIPLKDL